MARAALTIQTIPVTGLTSATVTYTAPTGAGANNGWSFSNSGSEIVAVKNTDTATKAITRDIVNRLGGILPADDTAIVVPAAAGGAPGYAWFVMPTDAFGGTAGFDVDNVTGVTAAVLSR